MNKANTHPHKVTREECIITVRTEPEDMPVRGNAMASGDPQLDREVEDSIIERLESGDEWAWCRVVVNVWWGDFDASASIGACSYDDEADFCQPGGYFDDLVDEALEDLNEQILHCYMRIQTLLD